MSQMLPDCTHGGLTKMCAACLLRAMVAAYERGGMDMARSAMEGFAAGASEAVRLTVEERKKIAKSVGVALSAEWLDGYAGGVADGVHAAMKGMEGVAARCEKGVPA